VASRLAGVTDYTLDLGHCGRVVDDYSEDAFCEAILETLGDSESTQARRLRAHQRCRDLFTVERMAQQYLDTFGAFRGETVRRSALPDLCGELLSWKHHIPGRGPKATARAFRRRVRASRDGSLAGDR